ncbi:MAG: DUF177 domain-containing protein [Ramlibacter sp.]
MSKEFSARSLDVKRFAEEGGKMEGQQPLSAYKRLMAETHGRNGEKPVTWSIAAELRNAGHVNPEIWMHLNSLATLELSCQRCLAPVEVPVEVDRAFRFVSDEEAAAAQDEQSEEDVLALSRSFDLLALVEDEILMEMPLAPRHESCPVPVTLAVADEDIDDGPGAAENPFAVLGRFKPRKS